MSWSQRGLKDTEHKPLGRHYLDVTRTTISFEVQSLLQVKTEVGIMAVVVYPSAAKVAVPSVS